MERALILVMLLLAGCSTVSRGFVVDLQKEEDNIDIVWNNDKTIITVTSPSGIGGGRISNITSLTQNGFVRFQYAYGKRYNNLEAYSISTDNYLCDLSLRHGAMRADCCEIDKLSISGRLKCVENSRKTIHNHRFKLDYDFLEVPIPQEIFERIPKWLRLRWIDAYRG